MLKNSLKKKINKSSAPEYPVQFQIEQSMNQRYIQMLNSMNVTAIFNIDKALKNQEYGL